MSEHDQVWRGGEDVQVLENALRDSALPSDTRKELLKRASTTLLAAGGLGTLIAACGSSKSSSSKPSTTASTSTTSSSGGSEQLQTIINTAVTAEALAVTYLSAVVSHPGVMSTPVGKFVDVLKAANAEEYDHYKALLSLGAKPLTTKFWVPDAAFGHRLSGVFPTLQKFEAPFVNAYLIAITQFGMAGKAATARYASEIAGTEAQHLVLVNYAAGKTPPNNVGFMDYSINNIAGIVSAIEGAGIGLGKQGATPGKFASFAPPSSSAVTNVINPTPA